MLGWVQGLFGVIVLRGFCGPVGAGQCAAHYIMVRLLWIAPAQCTHPALGKRVYRLRDPHGPPARRR